MTRSELAMILQPTCFALLGLFPQAQAIQPTALDRVIAVEEADSTFGKYRIVFTVTEPLPAPRDGGSGPQFFLDQVPLRLPGDPRDRTLLFGYVGELPFGLVPLRMTSGWPADSDEIQAGELLIEPETLLRRSLQTRRGFELPHVRRSVGPLVDVGAAWTSADFVLIARFVRGEADAEREDVWSLTFEREVALHNPARLELSAPLVFSVGTPQYLYELGARYVLFGRATAGAVDPARLAAVRVWQPKGDALLNYLEERRAFGEPETRDEAQLRRLRELLVDSLDNQATEVRWSAATELARRPEAVFALTEAEVARIREHAAAEPHHAVSSALLALTEKPGVAPR